MMKMTKRYLLISMSLVLAIGYLMSLNNSKFLHSTDFIASNGFSVKKRLDGNFKRRIASVKSKKVLNLIPKTIPAPLKVKKVAAPIVKKQEQKLVEEFKSTKKVFKDGKYRLYRATFKDTTFSYDSSNFFDGEIDIQNGEDGHVDLSLESVSIEKSENEFIELPSVYTDIKGNALFTYDQDDKKIAVTIRMAGEHDIVVRPISGKYKGATLYFSTKDKRFALNETVTNKAKTRKAASVVSDQDRELQDKQQEHNEEIFENFDNAERDQYELEDSAYHNF